MENCNENLKYMFRCENALGTCSVTLDNPRESPYKKLFSCILITLITSHNLLTLLCLFVCKETPVSPWYIFMIRILRNSFVVCILVMGLINSEGKRTTVVNLAAIETHLRELNIEVPNNSLDTAAAFFTGGSLAATVLVALSALHSHHFTIFDSALYIYAVTVKHSQVFGCLLLLLKCLRAKMAICNELDNIHHHCIVDAHQVESGPYIIQRRVAWAEGSEHHRRNLRLVRSVDAALNACLQEVKSCYHMVVIWLSVMSAMVVPTFCLMNTDWSNLFSVFQIGLYFTWHLATYLSVVLLVTQLQKVEESYEDKLRALRATSAGEESRRDVRHLLLRHVHSSEPYNCYLFDVDFGLISTTIETILFVFTTYLSSR